MKKKLRHKESKEYELTDLSYKVQVRLSKEWSFFNGLGQAVVQTTRRRLAFL